MRRKLLYILAPSFSGSTLLTYLLAQHQEIATVGELKATQIGPVEKYLCSCGVPILDCGFWQSMQQKTAAAGLKFSADDFGTVFKAEGLVSGKVVGASVRGAGFEWVRSVAIGALPGLDEKLAGTARQNAALADIICQLQGGTIFLDGSKDPTRLLHLIRSNEWDVKVIYLQRDGRGVSLSTMSHGKLSLENAVKQWRQAARELQRMRNRLADEDTFDLHYEHLCESPAKVMHRIWEWLGIDPLEIQERHFKSGDYHILGNAMRLNAMAEIRLDEKWRTELRSPDLQTFERIGGNLNRSLGYGKATDGA